MSNVVKITVRADDETRGFAGIHAGLDRALAGMKGIALAAGADLATSLAGPVVAAAGTAVAAFASAGAALGAFGLAAAPQLGQVTAASELYAKAQKSAAAGSKSAAKDMEAYKKALAGMPPATRDTAVAFAGLKEDFKKWSDGLASSTMPVFTKGIGVLRKVLPELTPLVKVGASALSGFMDSIDKGVSGGGMKSFIGKLTSAAKETLPALLNSVKNVVVGLGGLVGAFLPFSGGFAQGLERLTKRFADFGQSLGQNKGFQQWMQEMKQRAPGVLEMIGNIIGTVANVAQALAPFSGLTLVVAEALAKMVAAIPPGVMDWLAPAISGIVLAVKAWGVVQGILNVALRLSPLGAVALLLAGLVAGLIYAYKHSETFRRVVDAAWKGIKEAASNAWDFIKPILRSLAEYFTGTVAPAARQLADKAHAAFDKIKETVTGAWDKIKPVLKEMVDFFDKTIVPSVKNVADTIGAIGESVDNLPGKFKGLKSGFPDLKGGSKGKGPSKNSWGDAAEQMAKPWEKAFDVIKGIVSDGLSWIGDHWRGFYDDVLNINQAGLGSIVDVMLGGIGPIGHTLTGWWPAAQKRWDSGIRAVKTSTHNGLNAVTGELRKLPGQVAGIAKTVWSSLPKSLSQARAQVASLLASLRARISSTFSGAPGWLRAAGRAIIDGLINGINSGIARVQSLLNGLTGMIPDWKGPPAKDIKLLHNAGHLIMQGLLNGLEGQVSKVKSKMAEVTAAIRKNFDGSTEDGLVAWVKRNTEKLVALADKRDAVAKRIADAKKFAKDTASNLVGSSGIGNLSDEEGSSPGRIQQTLQQRAGVMASFARVIEALKKKGLNATGLQEIIGKGADAGSALGATILSGGSSGIKALNNAQAQLAKAAGKVGNAAADALYDAGKGAAKGFLTGLKAQKAGLQTQMDHLAEHFAKALTKVFKVKPGITRGHATGGPAGGLAMVGEMGRELVRLPYGSSVIPNGQTEAMMSGGRQEPIVIQINTAGSRMDELFIEVLRKSIRARGGDVQIVLGQTR